MINKIALLIGLFCVLGASVQLIAKLIDIWVAKDYREITSLVLLLFISSFATYLSYKIFPRNKGDIYEK